MLEAYVKAVDILEGGGMSHAVIRTRIDTDIKEQAHKLFEGMGLSMSEALRLFVYQSIAEHGLPFRVNIPNTETLAAMKEVKEHLDELEPTSLEQLAKEWNDARA